MSALTWYDLATMSNRKGLRVVFDEAWDIFPITVIPQGTHATVIENCLNERHCRIEVLPDSYELREKLAHWQGMVILGSHLDPSADLTEDGWDSREITDAEGEWFCPSPLRLEVDE